MILRPKNWETFQHYKTRRPPWIKLHHALLDNYDYCCLPDASKALAPQLWLLASEYQNGAINAEINVIAFRLRKSETEIIEALKPLISSGFFSCDSDLIATCKRDASELLAERKQVAIAEKRRDREREEKSIVGFQPTKYAEEFSQFWIEYPRSKNMSKAEAAKAWRKLSAEDQQKATQAIAPYKQFLKEHPKQETVHAVRFLTQRRFDGFTEPEPIAPKNGNGGGFYAKPESPQLEAWDAHRKANGGIAAPRDAAGGWRFPSEWPPGYELKRELMAGLE